MIVCDHSEYHCNVEYNIHKPSIFGSHTLIEIYLFLYVFSNLYYRGRTSTIINTTPSGRIDQHNDYRALIWGCMPFDTRV